MGKMSGKEQPKKVALRTDMPVVLSRVAWYKNYNSIFSVLNE